MSNIPTVDTFVGDSAPDMTITVTREDGSIVDLTGCTVLLKILDPTTGNRTNDGWNTCFVTLAAQGQCVYSRQTGDFPEQGMYQANLKVIHGNGKVETGAVQILVHAAV